MAKRRQRWREMSISEWLAEQQWLPAALARLAEPRGRMTMASVRRVTAETEFQDKVAEIVAQFSTGDDPTSARYQAHSFIQETEIFQLFLKRQDAEDSARGRRARGQAARWARSLEVRRTRVTPPRGRKKRHRPILELRAKFPKKSKSGLAGLIIDKLTPAGVALPKAKRTVEGWVSTMDKVTPIYRELRATLPRASANEIADGIMGKLGDLVLDKPTVARWVCAMEKHSRPPA